ncbi:hypothetical protein [Streptomyces sp. NPDC057877]|uniref:hypothetical protein n=1 Tax=Streptomyces sp. NPDC057877 TaxID=3346269 RepID=UPI003686804F
MTTHASDNHIVRPPETGWTAARRLRSKGGGPRTWLPAVEERDTAARPPEGPDGNIVRGED